MQLVIVADAHAACVVAEDVAVVSIVFCAEQLWPRPAAILDRPSHALAEPTTWLDSRSRLFEPEAERLMAGLVLARRGMGS